MLRLIMGRAGRGKTARIFNEIKAKSTENPTEKSNIFIVPEQYSHAAERELCRFCGDSASLYAEVLSFTRLADRVFSETGGLADQTLDGAGRILAMDMAVKTVENRLEIYRGVAGKPEYLEKLLDCVDEIKSCAISPEQLDETADKIPGGLGRKLSDLALIASAYDAITGKTDPRDRLTKLADVLREGEILRGCVFYIDGFTDFTAQELCVLNAILRAASSVTVALTCEGLTGEDEIFECSRRTAVTLKRMAGQLGIPVQEENFGKNAERRPLELSFLEKHIFSPGFDAFDGDQDRVEVIKAATASEECEIAAAKVRQLIKEHGYKYSDIAVTARGFSVYETMAERIFGRYGVPAYVGKKSDILQKPVLMLLTSALETVTGGWRYESVMGYIKTGLTGLTPQQCDKLESYVYMWNIRGAMWERDEDWSFSPGGYGAIGDMTDDLAEINRLRRMIAAPLIRLRQTGKRAENVKEQVMALYEFLEEIALPKRLKRKAEEFEKSGDRQLSAEYMQLWSVIIRAMEQCVHIEGGMMMRQKEFAEIFKLTLSQYGVSAIPMSLDRVGMGEMDRMRRRDVKCLIILGAHDESLPASGSSRGILSDADRETLIGLGLSLSNTASERLERELGLIYNAITMATDRVTVIWPTVGADGKAKRPSSIVLRLMDMFDLRDIQELDYRTWAAMPCVDLALSAGILQGESLPIHAEKALNVEEKNTLERIRLRAVEQPKKLDGEIAKKLFGEKLKLSASRLETYSLCHFRYFMQYGLGARESKKAEFDAPAAGSFVHFILENVIREVGEGSGFKDVSETALRNVTDKYIEIYIKDELQRFKDKTQRFIYLFERLRRETYDIVTDVAEELGRGDFEPLDFELTFSEGGDRGGAKGKGAQLPPIEFSDEKTDVSITGIIDRVDGWVKGDSLYLRVMDYKTGIKEFSLSDIWYGIGMQLLIYLFAICEDGREYYGKKPAPAGVLYAPARDVILTIDRDSTDEEIKRERNKKLKRHGILINDPVLIEAMEDGEEKRFLPIKMKKGEVLGENLLTAEQFNKLAAHIKKTVIKMGREMFLGDIKVNPAGGSVKNPCEYCGYRSACQLEENSHVVRHLKKLKNEQVLELIDSELAGREPEKGAE